jgi:hypothetical protein
VLRYGLSFEAVAELRPDSLAGQPKEKHFFISWANLSLILQRFELSWAGRGPILFQ